MIQNNNKKEYPYMTYDDEAKAIYIYLSDKKIVETKTLTECDSSFGSDIYVDKDKDGNYVGVEILLSGGFNKRLARDTTKNE